MSLSRISEIRQRKGLTQKQVAEQLGMTVAGFQNWERGRHNKKLIERIARLCQMFECSANDLVDS